MKNQQNPCGPGDTGGPLRAGDAAEGRAGISAAVLAGGASSRMSAPKAGLDIGGLSILDRELDALCGIVGDVMVIARPGGFGGTGRARFVPDTPEFDRVSGPMRGIYTALEAAGGKSVFVVGCDMPFIRPELVSYLVRSADGRRAVVPVVDGYHEPLFAVYPPDALDAARRLLRQGRMKLTGLLGELEVMEVGEDTLRIYDPGLVSFTNVNTPDELERARALASGLTRQEGMAIGR